MVKKSKKLVSIIIRGKNESKWLKILFKELAKQSVKSFEIIFCDNNSTDNTIDILKKNKVKKILKFSEYKPGKILNRAVKNSSGKYIAILSSHCIPVNKFWLKEHIDAINSQRQIVAVYGKQIPMPGSGIQNLIDLDIIFKDQPIVYSKDPYLNNANALYTANFLKKNLFDPKLTNIEDRVWANKMVKKNHKILYSAKSAVFHLHGIHQHKDNSHRAQTTYNILKKKYNYIWKNCDFLKPKFNEYALIINARRIKTDAILNKKIELLNKKLKSINTNFKEIILITDSKLKRNINKIKCLNCKKTLKDDLKGLYKKYNKIWPTINYGIYINLNYSIDYKKIDKLIFDATYYQYESITFAEKFNENFIINYKGSEKYKSIELGDVENKPSITLLRWSKGCVFDPDYLRKGVLFSNNTSINLI